MTPTDGGATPLGVCRAQPGDMSRTHGAFADHDPTVGAPALRHIHDNRLWTRHAGDRDPRPFAASDAVALVDLALDERPVALAREAIVLRIPLHDGPGTEKTTVALALRSVRDLIDAGVPTLVACSNGMNRSVAIAVGGLAMATSSDPAEILRRVAQDGPCDVSPHLWDAVVDRLAH